MDTTKIFSAIAISLVFLTVITVSLRVAYKKTTIKNWNEGKDTSFWLLILSNIAYFIPMIIVFIKTIQKTVSWPIGVELMLLYAAVIFFSTDYHWCRGELSKDVDPNELQSDLEDNIKCKECPVGLGMNYQRAWFLDHFFATYVLGITLLVIAKINNRGLSDTIRVLLLVVVVGSLSFSSPGKNKANKFLQGVSVLPLVLIILAFGYYWWVNKTSIATHHQIFYITGGMISALAMLFFSIYSQPYWLMHSLWHILGGIAGAFLLIPLSC